MNKKLIKKGECIMNIIGLDFGTTNSIVSFYNSDKSYVDSWKMGGVDGEKYIASVC